MSREEKKREEGSSCVYLKRLGNASGARVAFRSVPDRDRGRLVSPTALSRGAVVPSRRNQLIIVFVSPTRSGPRRRREAGADKVCVRNHTTFHRNVIGKSAIPRVPPARFRFSRSERRLSLPPVPPFSPLGFLRACARARGCTRGGGQASLGRARTRTRVHT